MILAFAAVAGMGLLVPDSYLITDKAGIEAARRKAERFAWARAARDRIVRQAEEALTAPLDIPERGGQWESWYSCGKDAARLLTRSPTEHVCPVCGTVYSGEPYDSVVLGRRHDRNASDTVALGLAFRLSDRKELARRAAAILSGYAAKYPSFKLFDKFGGTYQNGGRVFSQSLDDAQWLTEVSIGYGLVRDTIEAAERRRIEQSLLLPAGRFLAGNHWGIHNKQCWINAAAGLAGLVSGDRELVREAIDHPVRGFRALIAKGVTEEGLWFERSLGYHYMVMRALWLLAESARQAGIYLYSGRFLKMWDAPLALSLPGGVSPGFNDNPGQPVQSYAPLFEIGFARSGKAEHGRVLQGSRRDSMEALLFGIPELPSGGFISEESVLLKDAGIAVLRSKAGVTVAMKYGHAGGGHAHADKLGIVTFGAGQLFGLDPGSVSYGTPMHTQWYTQTVAHNTVAAARSSQAFTDVHKLEQWSSDGDGGTITASTDGVYSDFLLRRTLRLEGNVLDDRFEVVTPTRNTIDYVFHALGEFSSSLAFAEADPRVAEKKDGYGVLADVKETRTDGPWWARWRQGDARLTVHFQGRPDTIVQTALGHGRTPIEKARVILVRRQYPGTVFEAKHVFERLVPRGDRQEGERK